MHLTLILPHISGFPVHGKLPDIVLRPTQIFKIQTKDKYHSGDKLVLLGLGDVLYQSLAPTGMFPSGESYYKMIDRNISLAYRRNKKVNISSFD